MSEAVHILIKAISLGFIFVGVFSLVIATTIACPICIGVGLLGLALIKNKNKGE